MCSYKKVQGAYDLVLHNYGPAKTIGTIHIRLHNGMRADEFHVLTKQIAKNILDEYGLLLAVGIYAANDKEKYKDIKRTYLE